MSFSDNVILFNSLPPHTHTFFIWRSPRGGWEEWWLLGLGGDLPSLTPSLNGIFILTSLQLFFFFCHKDCLDRLNLLIFLCRFRSLKSIVLEVLIFFFRFISFYLKDKFHSERRRDRDLPQGSLPKWPQWWSRADLNLGTKGFFPVSYMDAGCPRFGGHPLLTPRQ